MWCSCLPHFSLLFCCSTQTANVCSQNWSYIDNTLAQTVSCWAHTMKARVWSHAIPRVICCGQRGSGQCFLRVFWFALIRLIPPVLHTYSFSCLMAVPYNGRVWLCCSITYSNRQLSAFSCHMAKSIHKKILEWSQQIFQCVFFKKHVLRWLPRTVGGGGV